MLFRGCIIVPPTLVTSQVPTYSTSPSTNWTPKPGGNTGNTPSFTMVTGDVFVGLSASESQVFNDPQVTSAGLTMTLLQDVNVNNYCRVKASGGVVASNSSNVCGHVSAASSHGMGFRAYQFRDSDGLGTSGQVNNTGTPTYTFSTLYDNSTVVILIADWNAADGASRGWLSVNGSGPTETDYFRNAAAYTVYTAVYANCGAAGSKTFGLSGPAGQKFSIVAVEIRGSTSGGSTTDKTVAISAGASVSLLKAMTKSLPISATRTVSVLKQAQKRTTIPANATVAARKAVSRSISVAAASTVVARKAVGKVLGLAATSSTAIAASRAFLKSVSISLTGSVGIGKQTGKRANISSSASVSVRKAISRTLSITATSSVAVLKAVARALSIGATSTVSLGTNVTGDVANPPSFANWGNFSTTVGATSVSPAIPSSTATGDIEFLQAVCINSTTAFSVTKSGTLDWELLYDVVWNGSRYAWWWKRKESGETAPSVVNTGRTSSNLLAAAITTYTGAKSDDIPIGGYSINYGTGAVITGPDLETIGRNSLAINLTTRIGANSATGPDILWTEDRDNGTSGGGAARYYVDSQIAEYPSIIPGVDRSASGNFVSIGVELLGESAEIDFIDQPHNGAMWVWDFEDIVGNSIAEGTLIDSCLDSGIQNLYCYSFNTFVAANGAAIKAFISDCTAAGIKVWGLDGDRSYFADADGSLGLLDNIQEIIDYNSGATADEKFYGFHIDCEPPDAGGYTAFHNGIASSALSTTSGSGVWQDTEALDREYLMRDWVAMHEDCLDLCSANGLKLATALPTWFDDYFGEPVVCTYDSVTQNVFLHLREFCDHISLMSYSTNPKTVISRIKYEILNCGDATIGMAVETHPGAGSGISYADTTGKDNPGAVYADIDLIHNRFSQYPGYSAFHIHDWQGWKSLNGIAGIINLTLNITSAASVAVRKAVARVLPVAASSSVQARKGANKGIAVNSAASMAASRGLAKLINSLSTTTVTVRRASGKNISFSSSPTITVRKAVSKTTNIAAAITFSASAIRAFLKTVSIAATSAVTIAKASTKTIVVNAGVTVSVLRVLSLKLALNVAATTASSLQKTAQKAFSTAVSSATTASAIRAIEKIFNLSVATTSSIRKAVSKTIPISAVTATAVGFGQFLAMIIDVSVATSTSLRKAIAKQIPIASTGTVAVRKAVSRTLSISRSIGVSIVKSLPKSFTTSVSSAVSVVYGQAFTRVLNMSSSATVTVRKQAGKTVAITKATSVSLRKAVTRTLAVAATGTVTVRKAVTKALTIGSDVSVAATKSVSKAFSTAVSSSTAIIASRVFLQVMNIGVTSAVSMGRAIEKTVDIASTGAVSVGKALERTVNIAATAVVRVSKAISKSFTSWVSIQQTAEASSPFLPEPTPAERTVIVDFEDRTVISDAVERTVIAGDSDRTAFVGN